MRGNKGWSTAPGAGRPATERGTRPQHQIRAFDDEWQQISRFAAFVKSGKSGLLDEAKPQPRKQMTAADNARMMELMQAHIELLQTGIEGARVAEETGKDIAVAWQLLFEKLPKQLERLQRVFDSMT